MDSQICGFVGNPDLYGIGVRVGLYLQWITTLLTTLFEPKDEDVLRIVNLLIQSAIFIGMVLLTSYQEVQSIEPVLAIWLIFGALSSLSGSGMDPLGHFSGIFRVLLYTGVAGYACWFWFTGLDGLLAAQPGCEPIAFFGGISISGRFRTFNKFASVFGALICLIFIILSIKTFVRRRQTRKLRPRSKRAHISIELLFVSISIICISIVAIEYLITANKITGINQTLSVGQLIPLLVGAISFAETIWILFREKPFSKGRCWVLFKHHLS